MAEDQTTLRCGDVAAVRPQSPLLQLFAHPEALKKGKDTKVLSVL